MSAAPSLSSSESSVRGDEPRGLDVTTLPVDATGVTLQLHGDMDLSNADLLTAVLGDQLGLGRRFVRLDVSHLEFLDCAGLRAIVQAHNTCLCGRGTLVLFGMTPAIARLLAITHLDEALLVADGPDRPHHTRDSAA